LVSPARRRRAVTHLQQVFGVSQRWACQLVGQHRSTQRHQPAEPERDRALREQLRQFSRIHPRWGYRRAHAQLRQAGWCVNRKAIQRLWREEGLRVPARRRKRQRLGTSTCPADRLVAERQTAPRFLRCDNGPELTANALRDWCRFAGTGTSYIEPGSPWQNPYVESFGGRLRDELLAVEAFSSLLEAQVLVEDWRIEYNTLRPHSALGYRTPAQYARAWTINQPALS
jgi:putative transposase